MKVESRESRVEMWGSAPASGAVRRASRRTLRAAVGIRHPITRLTEINDEGVIDRTRGGCAPHAFTLIEMLVVLAIMGILAALTVPALKDFGHSDAMTAADQQMLGAVARARQLAMSQRTTVYMVFVPANFWNNLALGSLTRAQQTEVTNLCGDQLTGYNFLAHGAMGDQPGQHQWHYLEKWQTLPDGTYIMPQKFDSPAQFFYISSWDRDYHNDRATPIYGFDTNNFAAGSVGFPMPTADSLQHLLMPYVAFNYLGQLTTNGVNMANRHEYIPLVRGAVAPAIDPKTQGFVAEPPPNGSPRIIERPPGNSTNAYNIINIDPLTGRATLETPKIQ